MIRQELSELVEAALTARAARRHYEETSRALTLEADVFRNDAAIAAAIARDETQHRLDTLLDAYERRKREAMGT